MDDTDHQVKFALPVVGLPASYLHRFAAAASRDRGLSLRVAHREI
jgi:hypothetical protein